MRYQSTTKLDSWMSSPYLEFLHQLAQPSDARAFALITIELRGW